MGGNKGDRWEVGANSGGISGQHSDATHRGVSADEEIGQYTGTGAASLAVLAVGLAGQKQRLSWKLFQSCSESG